MKLQRLKITNFRGIDELELMINDQSTVLFGINGSGKTSILDAITIAYASIISRFAVPNKKVSFSENDITYGKSFSRIEIDIIINGQLYTYFCEKKRMSSRIKQDNRLTLDNTSRNHIVMDLNTIIDNKDIGTPIYCNYGVHRAVFNIPLRIRNQHNTFDELVAFENCLNPKTDYKTFFEWYRNQEDIENAEKRVNNDYVDLPLKLVQSAIYEMLPMLSDLKVSRKPKLRMVVTKNKQTLEISQLSDGEKCLLALPGDIARRLAIANPNSQNCLLGEGLVLIDEVELHLHPQWQRKIIRVLKETFPNVQFIMTTHSPQVLGELEHINVFRLSKINNIVECKKVEFLFGRDSNLILEQYMDTKKEDPDISNRIRELFDLIDDEQFDMAKVIYSELTNILTPLHSELVKAEILIRRGKTKK